MYNKKNDYSHFIVEGHSFLFGENHINASCIHDEGKVNE